MRSSITQWSDGSELRLSIVFRAFGPRGFFLGRSATWRLLLVTFGALPLVMLASAFRPDALGGTSLLCEGGAEFYGG